MMTRDEIVAWLREEDASRLQLLWRQADEVRRQNVGDAVHLRGLIEFSNHCVRRCAYCGIRGESRDLQRYRMDADEIMACARQAVSFGYGTIVLQSGEDDGITTEWMADLIRRVKSETPLAITLSLGERPDEDLAAWREASADRYLLRFETSDRELYERIHPPRLNQRSDRMAILRRLKELGYETGSGVMVGIPGQTFDMLATDIEIFQALDLDMVGLGPYIAHPATPLAQSNEDLRAPSGEQVPNTEAMTYKVLALTRLVRPLANIPSTTALATVNPEEGRELGLTRGANVVMPNLTPQRYRALYSIYPAKASSNESPEATEALVRGRILSMGRRISTGRGDSPNYMASVAKGRRASMGARPAGCGKA